MQDDAWVCVFDTSLRDGEQAPGFSMTAVEKLYLARQLDSLGVDVIEAGFPIASDGDFAAVRAIAGDVRRPVIAALARAVPADVKRAAAALEHANRPRIHVFLATSDLHLRDKLRITRSECLEQAAGAVRLACQYTDDVEFSAEDASRSDLTFLCEVAEAVAAAGASTVNLPDTVGYALPCDITQMFAAVRARIGDKVVLSAHCHDDLGMAVANSLAALQAGARQVECTINGIGERAGNASLEEIVMALHVRRDRLPLRTRIRTEQLCPASRLLSEIVGVPVPPNKAIVGTNAFAHEAGIHQDGVLKNPLTYEIMRPETVGAPGTRLVLGKHSGTRGVDARCRALGFHLRPDALARVYARLVATADRVKAIEDFHIADAVAADRSVSQELRPCV
jgi:2-isopropylmalate synthase